MGVRESGGGALGTIFTDLEVPDLATPPLGMSGLMLSSVDTGGVPTGRAEQLKSRLPIVPSTTREFRSSDELVIFAEVYDNERVRPHTVDVTASDSGRRPLEADQPPSGAALERGPCGEWRDVQLCRPDSAEGFETRRVFHALRSHLTTQYRDERRARSAIQRHAALIDSPGRCYVLHPVLEDEHHSPIHHA